MSIKRSLRVSSILITVTIVLLMILMNGFLFRNRIQQLQSFSGDFVTNELRAGLPLLYDRPDHYTDDQIQDFLENMFMDTDYNFIIVPDDRLSEATELVARGTRFTVLRRSSSDLFYELISVEGYNKHILIYAPIGDMNNTEHRTMILVMTSSFIALVILNLYFVFLSRSITKPIDALTATIKDAADGNLDVQCNVESKNEVGVLAKNFNRMIHIINSNYEDLSSMHEELQANEEELRKNYDHIEFLAYHDVLTRLPNKIAFYDRIYNTLNARHADEHRHAIYFVDLDNFKAINDTLGHDYGDELLAQTANKLNQFMRPQDILARAGGDEFLIFRADIDSKEEAIRFGEQILESFKAPFDLNGEIAHISMSIGVSIYPSNGHTHSVLIRNADIAMYHSKDTGKNKITVFTSEMQQQLQRESDILEALRHAIKHDEIYLVYQPQFDVNTNEVIGYEALMRINSAKLGPISPTEFIPVAESNGLIYEMGLWAMRSACAMNQRLIERGYSPRKVAVNVSSVQLKNSDFLTELRQILDDTGLDPKYLEIELTESVFVASIEDASKMLNEIRKLGISISLDDFGTGYSSLNYLANMPFTTLKIDKSFVDNIFKDHKDTNLAESIITLAHSMGITVVAEGVENGTQLSLLRAMHCDLIQGFLLSKPLLQDQLTVLLD